jgi:ABC-type glycerol-3-phosphate transport system substrate-binding protein
MPALNPIPARALGAAALAVALTACGGQSSEPAAAEAPAALQWDPDDQELTIDEAQAMVSSFEEEIGAPLPSCNWSR